jgi:hypothetical protein
MNMTALKSFLNFLTDGNEVTSRQARTLFKVKNVADLAYRARNAGVTVYTNRVTNSRGVKVFAYRLGTPSRAFSTYRGARQVARSRKTLYRDAINVTLAA